jgi:hypothetical protein
LQKTGELGVGKTLTLSYLAWNNWYYKHRIIASNYTLYGIPHTRINTIGQFFKFIPEKETEKEILEGQEKWLGGDDFWKWIGSRCVGMGAKQRNEIINRILMASRKAFVTVSYTTQLFSMVDKNIRDITDLLFKPVLSPDMRYCKVYVYGVVEGRLLQPMQPQYFMTEPIFATYNTFERASNISMDEKEEELTEQYIPIEKNPAWKRYCKVFLGIDIDSDEYKKKCAEIDAGLKIGLNSK